MQKDDVWRCTLYENYSKSLISRHTRRVKEGNFQTSCAIGCLNLKILSSFYGPSTGVHLSQNNSKKKNETLKQITSSSYILIFNGKTGPVGLLEAKLVLMDWFACLTSLCCQPSFKSVYFSSNLANISQCSNLKSFIFFLSILNLFAKYK